MNDPVNRPAHYRTGRIEVIDFLRDQDFGYLAGNVVKYVSRYRHKGKPLEDLKKARWYLQRLIDELEQEAGVMDREQEKAVEVVGAYAEFAEIPREYPSLPAGAGLVRIKTPKDEWYLDVLLKRGSVLCGNSRDGRHEWRTPYYICGVQRQVCFCLCEAACYADERRPA